jgi:hypothetical protein
MFWRNILPTSSGLMETVCSPEMLVPTCQTTTQSHNPEDHSMKALNPVNLILTVNSYRADFSSAALPTDSVVLLGK